jgi:hypothetical protein
MENIHFQHRYGGTWYLYAFKFLKLRHPLHSTYEKSIIERTIQYIKDRTECFDDDYFPCRKEKCRLIHLRNWLNLFVNYHNKEVIAEVNRAVKSNCYVNLTQSSSSSFVLFGFSHSLWNVGLAKVIG